MKAELIIITKEMTGSTELAEALNNNFEAINDIEDAIFKGLKDMEARIIRSFNESMDIKFEKNLKPIIERLDRIEKRLNEVEKRLNGVEEHLGIDPNLLQE